MTLPRLLGSLDKHGHTHHKGIFGCREAERAAGLQEFRSLHKEPIHTHLRRAGEELSLPSRMCGGVELLRYRRVRVWMTEKRTLSSQHNRGVLLRHRAQEEVMKMLGRGQATWQVKSQHCCQVTLRCLSLWCAPEEEDHTICYLVFDKLTYLVFETETNSKSSGIIHLTRVGATSVCQHSYPCLVFIRWVDMVCVHVLLMC